MKTKTVTLREEWFSSLPSVETKCFVNDAKVTRAEFMRVSTSAVRTVADEKHSAGGKTVRHVIVEIPDESKPERSTNPTDKRAPFWKTAYALVSCARVKKGECVAVRYDYTGTNGTDWFEINKTERGEIDPVYYPAHHLERFCL